jgi:urease accessory protein
VTPLRPANRVYAQARITAEAGGRLPRLRSQAPLVLRPTPDAVYLVSAAGGPVGGDRLDLRIEVRAGAALRLRTVAASVALPAPPGEAARPGEGGESVLTVRACVASGGGLEYLPEPMVVADGARHLTDIRIDLAPGAALVLRDEIILGRHAERGGFCRTRLRVDYGGLPLLRHDVAVDGTDEVSLGPALLAGHRAHGTLLHAGALPPSGEAATTGGDVAVMPLAGPGVFVSALAPDSLRLRQLLDAAMPARLCMPQGHR